MCSLEAGQMLGHTLESSHPQHLVRIYHSPSHHELPCIQCQHGLRDHFNHHTGSEVRILIVKYFHEHGYDAAGTNQTLAGLSTGYWIIANREVIQEWEKECAECRCRKAKACQQVMAPLPISRLTTLLCAFTKTAVDFGCPFLTVQGLGKHQFKCYLCLFKCLATRAVHLEVAFGLDTDSFLNAYIE